MAEKYVPESVLKKRKAVEKVTADAAKKLAQDKIVSFTFAFFVSLNLFLTFWLCAR
jgi:hypothetical protein